MDAGPGARRKLEQWVIEKLEPLKRERRIILRDPQRMIQRDARAVDGWAHDNGFNALICTGNFTFRIWFEKYRREPDLRLLLVDQTREPETGRKNPPPPVFYPDMDAETKAEARLAIALKDFLSDVTRDQRWPELINGRTLSGLVLEHLDGVLDVHRQLRAVDSSRFTDTDLYRLVLGAMLGINPFKKPEPLEVRRLCMEQHGRLRDARRYLPDEVTEQLVKAIERSDPPFCWLLHYDEALVVRAFVLSTVLNQYEGLDYSLLLANFDPALAPLREIPKANLAKTAEEMADKAPDRLAADITELERFIVEDHARIKLLMGTSLKLHIRAEAIRVLKTEEYSPLLRSMALAGLLADLLASRVPKLHKEVLDILEREDEELRANAELFAPKSRLPLVVRRPSDAWSALKKAYRLAHRTLELAATAQKEAQRLRVAQGKDLTFPGFVTLWVDSGLSNLSLYLSELERTLRLQSLPIASEQALWEEFRQVWSRAESQLAQLVGEVNEHLNIIQNRFQDLYGASYSDWIKDESGAVVLTHQFVPRIVKRHWDPARGPRAWILVFDGMRVDAWHELVRPLFLERFDIIEELTGSALIPTETQLSRKAIFAGTMPVSFSDSKENVLLEGAVKRAFGVDVRLEVLKEEDDKAAGISVQYRSERLNVIIFNFTDKNLHGNTQDLAFIYRQTVGALIEQDVRSVLRQIGEDDLVFVTSDHGFTATGSRPVRVPEDYLADSRDVNHLVARLQKPLEGRLEQAAIQFPVKGLHVPNQTSGHATFTHVAFPRADHTLQRPRNAGQPDRYTHGGLSPAECLIPMVCLGPKKARDLPVSIDDLRVEGSLLEGEAASVVFSLVGGRKEVKVSIDCDVAGVRGRTEIFPGGSKSYRIEWRLPTIDQPTPEERDSAAAKRSVSVTVQYSLDGKPYRTSVSTEVRILLDSSRLRRPGSAKLDTILGLMPKKR